MAYDQPERIADGTACLQAALEYLAMGWSVLALCPHDHVGIARASKKHVKDCGSPGKRPWHTWTEFQDRLPTEEEVCQWWKTIPNSNVGIALGPVSGLIRIDVEGVSGEARLSELAKGDLPDTLEFVSGRIGGLGRGLLYGIPDGAKLRTTYEKPKTGEELRFQAKGAQTVLPPSRHFSGQLYTWNPGHGPNDLAVAVAPAWLLKELEDKSSTNGHHTGGKHRSSEEWDSLYEGVPEGERNDSATAVIGKCLGDLRDIENAGSVRGVWGMMKLWNGQNKPPLPESELQAIFASILKKERKKRQDEDFTALDRSIAQQIEKSAEPQPVIAPDAQEDCEDNALAEWQLVIVESDPPEFRLRSPYWSNSQKLKDGFLRLTGKQVMSWKLGVAMAAWMQAFCLTPPNIKGWAKVDGHLDRLKQKAIFVPAEPEQQADLYALGFFFRYLKKAKLVKVTDEGDKWPSVGNPTLDSDGSVWFKMDNLKTELFFTKQEFRIRELLRLLKNYGVQADMINNTRWWKVTKEVLETLGKLTKEG